MGRHTRCDEWEIEALRARHDAERLRRAAMKADDGLAVTCLIARARELEALAIILKARARTRIRRFTAGPAKQRA